MVRNYVKVGVPRHKGRLDDRTRDLACRLIRLGRSTADVVSETGVSRSQVQRLRKKLQSDNEDGGASSSGGRGGMGELIARAEAFARGYMEQYDASHDFAHVRRVLALGKRIEMAQRAAAPGVPIDGDVVTLACLLHDVGDKKYATAGDEDASTLVARTLEELGGDVGLAQTVQMIVNNVSYSNEVKNPQAVQEVLALHPELAIVQDADRLDAMGAIGIGRTFTFSAARGGGQGQHHPQPAASATMDEPFNHIEEKLVKLAAMMKTPAGQEMGAERDMRLRAFQQWWMEEASVTADLSGPSESSWTDNLGEGSSREPDESTNF